MNKYRTHRCNELRKEDVDKKISLSGWINKKRDHGNLLFIDLRDHYGLTQCVVENNNKFPWSLFLFIQPEREIFLSTSSFLNSLHLCVLYLFN